MHEPDARSVPADHRAPTSLQILLLTYQASALADDIFTSAAMLAMRDHGVQVLVAWGGVEGARAQQWRDDCQAYRDCGADVQLIEHPSPLERVRLSLAHPKDWVLPLADDDPIAVNYLRAVADATRGAAEDVSGVMAAQHLQNLGSRSQIQRLPGWPQTTAVERVLDMLARPGGHGTLFWSAYRQPVLREWLDFASALPYQASYLDQFLPHLAACRGRLTVAPEDTVLLRDECHWSTEAAATRTDARYYPHPDMTLFHELFWTADLWDLLRSRSPAALVAAALHPWGRQLVGRMMERLQARSNLLGLKITQAHIDTLQSLRSDIEMLLHDVPPADPERAMNALHQRTTTMRQRWLASGHAPGAAALSPPAATASNTAGQPQALPDQVDA